MLSDRILIQQRHQLWSELCEVTDQLLELLQRWWDIDHEMAAVHGHRCDINSAQPELPFAPANEADDVEF